MAPSRQPGSDRVQQVPRRPAVEEDLFSDQAFSDSLLALLEEQLPEGPAELAPGGNLVATGGSREPRHWREEGAKPVRLPSERQEKAPEDMAVVQARFLQRRAEEARRAEDEKKRARADFERYQKQFGKDFDAKAAEEYRESYATHGSQIIALSPYGQEMARLLRRHLGIGQ